MLERGWKELCFINNTYLFYNGDNELYEFYIACFSEDPLITSLPEYVSTTYNEKTKEYIYKMRVSNKYEEDFLLFLLGKYSLFTEHYKQTIYKLLGKNHKQSNIYKVINKDEKLKEELEGFIGQRLPEDFELTSIYNNEKETYNE